MHVQAVPAVHGEERRIFVHGIFRTLWHKTSLRV